MLNSTFHTVDAKLSELAAADGTHSGCTAVTAFLRLEDDNGKAIAKNIHVEEGQHDLSPTDSQKKRMFGDGVHREKIRQFVSGSKRTSGSATPDGAQSPPSHATKRTLYTANVGDARAVLR